jgi:hypothetical protein
MVIGPLMKAIIPERSHRTACPIGAGAAGAFAGRTWSQRHHCASHAHPGGLRQVFVPLMQVLPQALLVEQILQQVPADPVGLSVVGAVRVAVRCPCRQSHGAVKAPRQKLGRGETRCLTRWHATADTA